MSNSTALGLASFATGFLGGMNERRDSDRKNAALEEELAWKREQRQAEREKLRNDRELRVSLADAVRPAKVDAGYQVTDAAGSDAFTKDADAAAMMSDMSASLEQEPSLSSATRVQDTAYRDPRQAKAAQAEYNSQPAMLDRMATATMPHDPTKGMGLQSAAAKAREGIEAADKKKQTELDERFNTEVANIVSSRPDWWVAAAEMATNSKFGPIKDFTVTPEMSEDGKTVKFVATNPSGKKQTMGEFSADEAGAQKWMQASAKVDAKTKLGWLADRAKYLQEVDKSTQKHKLSLSEIEARGEQDRKTNAEKRYQGEAIGSEERKRYTQLFSDAGRRMSESQKSYNTLVKERAYANAKPGSRQEKELQDLRDAIKSYGEERSLYQSLLANAGSRPDAPAPTGLGSYRKEADLKGLAAGDMGADPAAIERELAAARADLAKVPDASSKQMLQQYIQKLEGQKEGLILGASKQAGSSKGPVKVSTKEEHAALPAGTKYIAPNGETYIKR